MAEVHLTAAQARALGLSAPEGRGVRRKAKPVRKRKPKRAYHTRCTTCGEEFRSAAAEERHLDEHRHARYELVLAMKGTEQ